MGRAEPFWMSNISRLRQPALLATALAMAVLMLSSAAPAVGARPESAGRSRLALALARVQLVRDAMQRGTLADSVEAAGMAGDLRAQEGLHDAASGHRLASVPPRLRPVVRDLLEAVGQAERWARVAVPNHGSPDRLWEQTLRGFRSRFAGGSGTLEVDKDALYTGSLILAGAVDDALPALRAYARRHLSAGPVVNGCDVADLAPALCIGGSQPNVYKDDAALLIDLGGPDRHLHSAGGADPALGGDGGNGLLVAVTIDVGGDDLYKAESPTSSGGRVFHGGGFYGGIGFLVDAGGNDRYRAISRKPFPESLGVPAQGFAVAGAGVLADITGDDVYDMDHRTMLDGSQAVVGGGAAGEGIGLQLDFGGDDSYSAVDRPLPHTDEAGRLHPGTGTVIAYGAAAAGPGILWDAGGKDSLTISAATVPPRSDRVPTAPTVVFAEGFGFEGLNGIGLALTGDGPTRWRVTSETSSHDATSVAYGFGQGSIGGLAAVSDGGGSDTYVLSARSSTPQGVVEAKGASALGFGMGMGNAGGTGLHHDLAGADRYTVDVSASGRSAFAQGSTQAYGDLEGVGLLLDEGGDDAYTSRVTTSAPEAKAIGNLVSGTQGAAQLGTSLFHDLSGDDRYLADARALVNGRPRLRGVSYFAQAQASVELAGTAVFIDGGGSDRYKSVPPDPPCTGTRGEAFWQDCGPGLGAGFDAP